MSATMAKTLKLERLFDASPKELWTAWTDPKEYAKWFNPAPGMDLVIHEFDVRPGGKIRFDMPQPDGNKNPQEGVFHSLRPHSEIVSGSPDKSFLLVTTFVPVGARTRLVVEVTGVPPEYHAMATVGWGAGFDKLSLVLAKRAKIAGQSWSMHRDFDCSADDLWAALTEPWQFASWVSPFAAPAEIGQFEMRPGGKVRFTMIGPDGTRYPEAEWLVEVADKPRLITIFEANLDRTDVFNGHSMRASMQIEARGPNQARLVLSQQGLPDGFPIDMAKAGFNAGLDKLAKLVNGKLTARAERTFDATPEQVWEAWTDKRQIAKWLAPWPGVDADVREADVRVGGRFKFVMTSPEGETFPAADWGYLVVDKPRELAIDMGEGIVMRALIAPVGARTRLVVEQRGVPDKRTLQLMTDGLNGSLDKIGHLLGKDR